MTKENRSDEDSFYAEGDVERAKKDLQELLTEVLASPLRIQGEANVNAIRTKVGEEASSIRRIIPSDYATRQGVDNLGEKLEQQCEGTENLQSKVAELNKTLLLLSERVGAITTQIGSAESSIVTLLERSHDFDGKTQNEIMLALENASVARSDMRQTIMTLTQNTELMIASLVQQKQSLSDRLRVMTILLTLNFAGWLGALALIVYR